MKIQKFDNFNKINETATISWYEAYEKFVDGQVVKDLADYNITESGNIQAMGVEFQNGYKFVSYGGGCSGYDCNTLYIISPNNEIVSSYECES
jgi:hypothetical protein